MRRRDDGKPCVAMVAQQIISIHSRTIYRHGVQAGNEAFKQLLTHKIARIFKHHLIATAGKRVQNQTQTAAVTAGYQHLLSRTG
ncbi:hypothetical protein D3C86_2017560 [compost metagenome]